MFSGFASAERSLHVSVEPTLLPLIFLGTCLFLSSPRGAVSSTQSVVEMTLPLCSPGTWLFLFISWGVDSSSLSSEELTLPPLSPEELTLPLFLHLSFYPFSCFIFFSIQVVDLSFSVSLLLVHLSVNLCAYVWSIGFLLSALSFVCLTKKHAEYPIFAILSIFPCNSGNS